MDSEAEAWISDLIARGNEAKVSPAQVKERFDAEDAASYGSHMAKWFPDYDYVHALLIDLVRPFLSYGGQVLDLGGGTGRVAKLLLDAIPSCRVVIQDISANMLSEVPSKLCEHNGKFECVEADFSTDTFSPGVGQFDSVVSVHAIHHGRTVDVYQKLYDRIFAWLKPGGCFACLDNVAGDTPQLATLNYLSWAQDLQSQYDAEKIRWIVETTIREDSPLSLRQHMELLASCGFRQTDVLWKKHIFGLYVAIKSPQQRPERVK